MLKPVTGRAPTPPPSSSKVNGMGTETTLALSAAIGAVAGLRSLTAPAIVARAAQQGAIDLDDSGLEFLGSPRVANTIAVLAGVELIVDKLPFAPNRTIPGSLLLRIVSGGICGAALCQARKQPRALGAILGATAAVGAAFAGMELRRRIGQELHAPGAVAIVEDAIAISGAIAAVSSSYLSELAK